jgi:hypothetical protein
VKLKLSAAILPPDQQLTKKLAEMKSYLERRIKMQEDEVNSMRSFLEVVDSLLAERSFRQVEIPPQAPPSQPSTSTIVKSSAPPSSTPILTTGGVSIASMTIEGNDMHIVPDPDVKLDSTSPPLRAFLLEKVLDPMERKDRQAASAGEIPPENILSYDLAQEDGYLKAIHIRNCGDDRRTLELKNAIRWTLRRMYEKIPGKK